MTPTRIALLPFLAAVVLLTGCFNSEREPIYVDSNEVDPIDAPSGLDDPQVRNIFTIPGYSLPELAAQGEQELPPEVQPSAEAERSRSQIRFGRTGLYLAVEDTVDSVWRRLGFSLDRGGMSIRSANESERRYVFRFSHEPIRPEKTGFSRLAFWSRPPVIDHSGIYIARVRPGDAGQTRVELLDEDGGVIDMERAEFVLARLRERLG
jgi:uncharacterized lipoprotein